MKYLSDFKAILFDIDRTLIPPTREIFPEVIKMLNKLHERGIVTGICTGRGYASIKNKLIPIFPNESVHIMAGGSLLIKNNGEILWQKTIEPKILEDLKEIVFKTNSIAIFMKPDAQYSSGEVLEGIKNHPWNQVGKDISQMSSDGVGLVYIAKPNDEVKRFLEDHPDLSYKNMTSNQGHTYYDITAKGVTKALAIEEWTKHTGIPKSQIIGFGDSENDIEFLENCGFSVAMGNAEISVKDITDKTIGYVTDKSLPNYVESILEGEPLWKLQFSTQEMR